CTTLYGSSLSYWYFDVW
nr:immunoglobulin heavy chain junction region [Mus musculus]